MSTEATPENLREAASWDPNPDDPDEGFALLRAAADRIEELEVALDQANRLLGAIADDLSVDMDDYIGCVGGAS